jgi:acyl-CoA synthetase (NDP forming)
MGTEVIVGVTLDPQFGHALMFGLGGIFVEVLKDVTFRLIPMTEIDAREMVRENRAGL